MLINPREERAGERLLFAHSRRQVPTQTGHSRSRSWMSRLGDSSRSPSQRRWLEPRSLLRHPRLAKGFSDRRRFMIAGVCRLSGRTRDDHSRPEQASAFYLKSPGALSHSTELLAPGIYSPAGAGPGEADDAIEGRGCGQRQLGTERGPSHGGKRHSREGGSSRASTLMTQVERAEEQPPSEIHPTPLRPSFSGRRWTLAQLEQSRRRR